MSEQTSISVDREVRNRIKSLKTGGESYSELLIKMVESYEQLQE